MKNQLNVNEWVALFEAAGVDKARREQWHKLFETRHPEGHQAFLEWLGVEPQKIKEIRSWSQA